ncbi:MAG: DegT/DnrJ/EryC1/StrS aminotransferase family protein [Treponema sp.]|nr:DegT/DnrJ/EryC1/StrS aminotransferase family protein [Treponema sp.]
MIQTYSTTIRRKEMDAVLTCMVDEKIGPGELNTRLIQLVKEFFKCDGAVALRSPAIALGYALTVLELEKGSKVMISALAPAWQYQALVSYGYVPEVLDVNENDGLVSVDEIKNGIENGGKILLLHETEGIVPKFDDILELGVPIIEDISMSAGASVDLGELDGVGSERNGNDKSIVDNRKKVGSFGVYTILGLEEKDVITAGGGAVLISPNRREWLTLKPLVDNAPLTDLLPDINSALAWVQLKEYSRNEKTRKELFSLFQRACLIGRHKILVREMEEGSTMSCFPLVLATPYKDVKQYTSKKDIEVQLAFENSVVALYEEVAEKCIKAKSLYLRCIHVPLYPRLTQSESAKIVKVLSSLP